MDYRAKMLKHLSKAEELNAEVDGIEAEALKKIGAPEGAVPANDQQAYQLKKALEHSELYRQKGNSRNLHMNLAIMYGFAIMAIDDDPTT